MLKIIHTSDWHLGHTLYGIDRTEEQQSMLEQMESIVGHERPDLFLVSGDIYHTSQPSAAVQQMLMEAIVRMHDTNPTMVMVLTAGNHDSASRHEIFRTPWRAMNVHTIGTLDKEHPESHIIELPGKGYIVAVPYAYERNIPDGFFQNLLDIVSERNHERLPVVMSAHTTVKGCDFTGHDHSTDRTVGGIDAYDLAEIGTGYDYLALGHIHRPQYIHSGKHNVRYSGTPLPISFDETFEHSVSLVTIECHGATPVVNTQHITNPWPLVTLPADGFVSWDEAKEELRQFPADREAYIRLNVAVDDYLPTGAHAEASALSVGKRCRFCHINPIRRRSEGAQSRPMTIQQLRQEQPIDIARRYAQDSGLAFDDDLAALFAEAVEETRNEN